MSTYHRENGLADLLRAIDPDLLPDVAQPERQVCGGEFLNQPDRRAIDRLVDQTHVLFLRNGNEHGPSSAHPDYLV